MKSTFSRPDQLTASRTVHVGGVRIGGRHPLAVIAGPCVIESREHTLRMARELKKICKRLELPLVFKASYDKANRTSGESFRGPGPEEGMKILREVKKDTGLPVLTDVHREEEAEFAANTVDMIQIPAFLCRQTDFVHAVGAAGKPVNVKKGQFLAPEDVTNIASKLREAGCTDILLTERGVSFGYQNLVSDFRSLPIMQKATGAPVCFDATHSVQQPGGLGGASGGRREFVPALARAACAVGVNALFVEVHDKPDEALSDAASVVALADFEDMMVGCLAVDRALRAWMEGK